MTPSRLDGSRGQCLLIPAHFEDPRTPPGECLQPGSLDVVASPPTPGSGQGRSNVSAGSLKTRAEIEERIRAVDWVFIRTAAIFWFDVVAGPKRRIRGDLGVFESEGHEDVVPLALEVVFGDRSARPTLVEVVEAGHDLRLVNRLGTLRMSTLLASFALGHFAVAALSSDASLVCALSHLDAPIVVRRVFGPGRTWHPS